MPWKRPAPSPWSWRPSPPRSVPLAARVSAELTIPTIGIGAGAGCDGQVLVNQDMLGMFHDFTPKFVRRFAEVGDVMLDAYRAYDAAVKDGTFPAAEHTYAAPAGVLETL